MISDAQATRIPAEAATARRGADRRVESSVYARRPLVLAIGMSDDEELVQRLASDPRFVIAEAESEREAKALVDTGVVSVVVTGPELPPEHAAELLTALANAPCSTANIVLGAPADKSVFQDLIDRECIFYLSEAPARARDAVEIIAAAVRHHARSDARSPTESFHLSTEQLRCVLDAARLVSSQRDITTAAEQLVRWIVATVVAERAQVLIHESDTDTLWAPEQGGGPERRESAAAGLAAFALRTSSAVQVANVGVDPRYDREADDPEGSGTEQIVAVPIASAHASPVGVLVAVRERDEPQFVASDIELLSAVAAECAPSFTRLLAENRLAASEADQLFRPEALASRSGDAVSGNVLRLFPEWTSWTYWSLVVASIAAVLFSLVVQVHDYATGPAVIRFEDKAEITTTEAGVVAAVPAHPGEFVSRDQPLVRLDDTEQVAEVERLTHEFDLQLAALLRDPTNSVARQQLASVRTQRDAASARLAVRTLRAPREGFVSGVRVRVGEKINAGDVALSLVGDHDVYVVAMLEGRYRAELKPGSSLRFELAGYEHVYESDPVESVGEVVTSQEALRYVGLSENAAEGDGAARTGGPVVIVRARLARTTYAAGGRSYRYHDGMPGRAEVRVRAEPVLAALIPAMRHLLTPTE